MLVRGCLFARARKGSCSSVASLSIARLVGKIEGRSLSRSAESLSTASRALMVSDARLFSFVTQLKGTFTVLFDDKLTLPLTLA